MTTFVFIKYPTSVLEGLSGDTPMPPDDELVLTQKGKKFAKATASNLFTILDGDIYIHSSPRSRCKETAETIGAKFNVNIIPDDRLDQRHIFLKDVKYTVQQYRFQQERGYLDSSRVSEGEDESPLSHRIRVEGWLTERIAQSDSNDVHIVVANGSVVEHLHSSMSWKPAGAMSASFTFCDLGHGHIWRSVELPNNQKIWCCLGANINFTNKNSIDTQIQGSNNLLDLTTILATDPRFQDLVDITIDNLPEAVYYIR